MERLLTLAFGGILGLMLLWGGSTALMYQWLYDGRIFQGVHLLGTDLSAYRLDEARAELLYRYDTYARKPIILRSGKQEWQATPAQLGLRFDVERTVQHAYQTGRNGSLFERILMQLRAAIRGYNVPEVALAVDDATLQAYLRRLEPQIDRAMREAALVVQPDLQVRVTPSSPGLQLQIDQTAARIKPVLLSLASTGVELVVQEATPSVVEADLATAKATAERMIGSPLVLQHGERTWRLDRQSLAAMLTFVKVTVAGKHLLEPRLDKAKLEQFLGEVAREVDQRPVDARFDYTNGVLKASRESRDGRQLELDKAVAAIQSQVAAPIRTVALPVASIAPKVSSADGQGLLPLDFIDSAKTEYRVGAAERIWNIELAAKRLNGVVVPPGDTFSFNREVGPTTLAAGFKWGWGITTSGEKFATVPSEAGGICQVATTMFQAVFWAGYAIEERAPHVYWIERYGRPPKGMKGLDATVDQIYDDKGVLQYQVDFKFTNNTDRPLLIQAHADGQRDLTFALYGGRPPWKVEVSEPKIEQVVPADPTPVMEIDPNAPADKRMQIEVAQDGFKSIVTRKVTMPGQQPRVLNLVSVYKPARNVFLVGPQTTPSPSVSPGPPGGPTPPGTPLPVAKPTAPPTTPRPVQPPTPAAPSPKPPQ